MKYIYLYLKYIYLYLNFLYLYLNFLYLYLNNIYLYLKQNKDISFSFLNRDICIINTNRLPKINKVTFKHCTPQSDTLQKHVSLNKQLNKQ